MNIRSIKSSLFTETISKEKKIKIKIELAEKEFKEHGPTFSLRCVLDEIYLDSKFKKISLPLLTRYFDLYNETANSIGNLKIRRDRAHFFNFMSDPFFEQDFLNPPEKYIWNTQKMDTWMKEFSLHSVYIIMDIISREGHLKKLLAIEFWVKVMEICQKNNNFFGVKNIISALGFKPVNQITGYDESLKNPTYTYLSKNSCDFYHSMDGFCDSDALLQDKYTLALTKQANNTSAFIPTPAFYNIMIKSIDEHNDHYKPIKPLSTIVEPLKVFFNQFKNIHPDYENYDLNMGFLSTNSLQTQCLDIMKSVLTLPLLNEMFREENISILIAPGALEKEIQSVKSEINSLFKTLNGKNIDKNTVDILKYEEAIRTILSYIVKRKTELTEPLVDPNIFITVERMLSERTPSPTSITHKKEKTPQGDETVTQNPLFNKKLPKSPHGSLSNSDALSHPHTIFNKAPGKMPHSGSLESVDSIKSSDSVCSGPLLSRENSHGSHDGSHSTRSNSSSEPDDVFYQIDSLKSDKQPLVSPIASPTISRKRS